MYRQLQQVGIIGAPIGLDMSVEAVLSDLEAKGWQLRSAAQRMWMGERDAVLTHGVDDQDRAFIQRLLEILAQGT
jgi:nucleoside diphosphate kinase